MVAKCAMRMASPKIESKSNLEKRMAGVTDPGYSGRSPGVAPHDYGP